MLSTVQGNVLLTVISGIACISTGMLAFLGFEMPLPLIPILVAAVVIAACWALLSRKAAGASDPFIDKARPDAAFYSIWASIAGIAILEGVFDWLGIDESNPLAFSVLLVGVMLFMFGICLVFAWRSHAAKGESSEQE